MKMVSETENLVIKLEVRKFDEGRRRKRSRKNGRSNGKGAERMSKIKNFVEIVHYICYNKIVE